MSAPRTHMQGSPRSGSGSERSTGSAPLYVERRRVPGMLQVRLGLGLDCCGMKCARAPLRAGCAAGKRVERQQGPLHPPAIWLHCGVCASCAACLHVRLGALRS